jgi:hypothetical protein
MTDPLAQRQRARPQPAQLLAAAVGIVYVVGGAVGLIRTGFGDFTGSAHAPLLMFGVNPLHNVVHVAVGVLGLLMAMTLISARLFGWLLFVVFGLLFVWGLMVIGVVPNVVARYGNPLNLNGADNWLHVVTAAVGLVIALLPTLLTSAPAVSTTTGGRPAGE